jgi:nucleotide-binding universal stress UspA family protein
MSIKRILVPLPGSVDHSAGEIDLAMSAARTFGAYVEALFITQPPPPARSGLDASSMRYSGGAMTAVALNPFAEERARSLQLARERFADACAQNDIPILATTDALDALPVAAWREVEGSYVETAVRRAPAFDLMIAASAAVMEALKEIAEQSLLQTRRPVLLAPSRMDAATLSGTAMIAWDESPQCWRAMSAAVPFLRLAKAVKIVSVDRNRSAPARLASQADAVAYLRCHGIAATTQIIAPDLRTVGDTLLAAAADYEVGLMVMGAYSHSRLRELLLGGATRHILKNATARPILMAH